MKWSHMLIPTLREIPKEAEATSHQLMLRAGLIRKLMSGVYSYLPLGYRVLQKVTAIIREEMNNAGAQELLLPAIHPIDLWNKTGRYDVMQDILMTVKKEGKQEIVLGPTHEEIITELAAAYISSYKDMPVALYQIQNKFRDEARPRFGVIRSKEFIMKDAYSFDADFESLDRSYQIMYNTYKKIFDRCGLEYSIVSADAGDMGGDVSHEFMVKLPFGEDFVVSCDACDFSASLDVAGSTVENNIPTAETQNIMEMIEFETPHVSSIEALVETYNFNPQQVLKTLIYLIDDKPVACLLRGDHELCESKLKKYLSAKTISLADEAVVQRVTGAQVGFAGPLNLKENIRIIGDFSIQGLANFVVGANKTNFHIKNVNFCRDFVCNEFYDLRFIKQNDICPQCGNGHVLLDRSLEIGHVFKLGTKYSKALNAKYLDQNGKEKDVIMGCYGIGVNRIIAACIELHNDAKGIVWPLSIAPFVVNIVLINAKEEKSVLVAEQIYADLKSAKIDVIYDDRSVRPGVKFTDSELIGIPLTIVVGERNLVNNQVEVKNRYTSQAEIISLDNIRDYVVSFLEKYK